jgi:hypothetical protein
LTRAASAPIASSRRPKIQSVAGGLIDRETAHILWPDEQAFIGTYRPMLVEEIVQKDSSTTRERHA